MTEPPHEHHQAPAVGPLALEAALLLDVVADRLTSMKRSSDSAAAPGAPSGVPAGAAAGSDAAGSPAGAPADEGAEPTDPVGQPGSAQAAPTDGRCPECGSVPGAYCTACPLCRFMALLRGERPEATARLVDGALMIIRTLRSLVPDPAEPAHQHPHTHAEPPSQPPSRRGGLEHIDIL